MTPHNTHVYLGTTDVCIDQQALRPRRCTQGIVQVRVCLKSSLWAPMHPVRLPGRSFLGRYANSAGPFLWEGQQSGAGLRWLECAATYIESAWVRLRAY